MVTPKVEGARRKFGRRVAVWASAAAAFVALTGGLIAAGSSGTAGASRTPEKSTSTSASKSQCGSLTIWTDATREPAVKDYEAAHPCVHVTTTVFGYTGSQLQTKIELFNKEGSGWPDLLWDPGTPDAGWLDSTQYHYAAPLNHGLVPRSDLSQWAFHSLSVCTTKSNVYCLRNDIAANVLWYNAPLMKKFGYPVPTTWAQYEKIGEEVAKQHPGYVIGTVGDAYADAVYFWGSGCPTNRLTGTLKVTIDMQAPSCLRMAKLLDTLLKDHTMSTLSITSPDFAKKIGDKNHLLMEVGATWYGQYILNADFKLPKATWGASYPLKWPGFSQTGDVGGGIWEVSSHAPKATQRLAAQAAYWLTSAPAYQKTAPTYPANKNAAKLWLANLSASHAFANGGSIANVFEKASNEIWPGYNFLLFNPEVVWGSTVVSGLVGGKSMTQMLMPWQTALSNQAKTFGYAVSNS